MSRQNDQRPGTQQRFAVARSCVRSAHAFGAKVEDVFLYEPYPDGENQFKDGVIIDVTFEVPSGGNMDSEGEEM